MGRFWAATRVAALFLAATAASPFAHACEACERVPLAAENSRLAGVPRDLGRLDVTMAVDTAASFVIKTVRNWRWFSRFGVASGEVDITQQDPGTQQALGADISDGSDVIATAGEWSVRLNVAGDGVPDDIQPASRMPNFRREHKWALTYRSEAASAISRPAPAERFPGLNATLDDSIVIGLRFDVEYGWTR